MRAERVNPNIELICDNCKKTFLRTRYEISRRRAKKYKDGSIRLHNFCSRSCSGSWRNKNRKLGDENFTTFANRPQFANKHGQKYNPKFAWYLKRMKHDIRFNECWKIDLDEMEEALEKLWTGRCCYTGVPIKLKDLYGKCDTENPFFIASIDRIDNKLPYGPTNVQWVSTAINLARNKHNADDFKVYLKEFIALI